MQQDLQSTRRALAEACRERDEMQCALNASRSEFQQLQQRMVAVQGHLQLLKSRLDSLESSRPDWRRVKAFDSQKSKEYLDSLTRMEPAAAAGPSARPLSAGAPADAPSAAAPAAPEHGVYRVPKKTTYIIQEQDGCENDDAPAPVASRNRPADDVAALSAASLAFNAPAAAAPAAPANPAAIGGKQPAGTHDGAAGPSNAPAPALPPPTRQPRPPSSALGKRHLEPAATAGPSARRACPAGPSSVAAVNPPERKLGPEDCGGCHLPVIWDRAQSSTDGRHTCRSCDHFIHSAPLFCEQAGAKNTFLFASEGKLYCSVTCKMLDLTCDM